MKTRETNIKLNKFDFTQLQGEDVEVTFLDAQPITDKEESIINYKLMFIVEGIENALISYTLYKLNKDNDAVCLKQVTALQLNALGVLEEETKTTKSGLVIKTGIVKFDPDDLRMLEGKTYNARLFVIDSITNGKTIKWVFLLPKNADTSILERIREQAEKSKYEDVLDNDKTVSFDSLRDNELSDISGQGW